MSTETIEGMRMYMTPSGPYPSMTTVLGGTMSEEKQKSLASWAKSIGEVNAKKITQSAADRGTNVHTMIERHLKGEVAFSPNEFPQPHINSFNALKLKLKNIDEIWCQEEALYSDTLMIAGRVDCIGVYKGEEAIIDFKTSSRLKSPKDIEDYRYQLCGYAIMHNEMFGTNISKGIILMTSDLGFPQEFKVDLTAYVEPLYDRVQEFYRKLKV